MKLPLSKKMNWWLEPPEIFTRLKELPYPFLLDTAMLVNGLGHHSFLGADPFLVMISKGRQIMINEGGKITHLKGSPMEVLKNLLGRFAMPLPKGMFPFNGGAVGYFSYDLGRQFKKIPQWADDDLHTPDLFLGFYDTVVAMDMRAQEISIISTGLPQRGLDGEKRARKRKKTWEKYLLTNPKPGWDRCRDQAHKKSILFSNFTPSQYRAAVKQAIEQIKAGEIQVVNLTQRFCTPQTEGAWSLYCKLREINPAPFGAFLSCGAMEIMSASPERFMKVTGDIVETRPIKGTRPRGHTPQEDKLLRQELWHSEKERAELKMVVDMERYYLEQVCEAGSVKVPELFRLEQYATVFQLVSTVEGRLLPGLGIGELLAATFPGGSITGAPKMRAMELIEEVESVRRGVYTGSIGYIGFDGQVDLSVVIRTILAVGGNLYFQVGGGITAASDPQQEYMETLDKARALVKTLGLEAALEDWL